MWTGKKNTSLKSKKKNHMRKMAAYHEDKKCSILLPKPGDKSPTQDYPKIVSYT